MTQPYSEGGPRETTLARRPVGVHRRRHRQQHAAAV